VSGRGFRRGLATVGCCAAFAVSGCKGCRSEKPYTPFGMASSLPSAAPSVMAAPSASAPVAEVPPSNLVQAPKDATRIRVAERELESPPGRVFDQLLWSDVNLDQKSDVFAFTLPAKGAPAEAAPGQVDFYPGDGPSKKLFEWPSFLPSGPSCTPSASLVQHTGNTLMVDLRASCTTQLVARAPVRAVAVLEHSRENPFVFGVRAADAAPGESLVLDVWYRDTDDDGRPDPTLRVGVNLRPNEVPPFVEFAWFDRAAGESRDARRTSKRLIAELDNELVHAQRKKTAARSLRRLDVIRRALFSACAESGTPRVFDWEGAPFACELTPDVIDRLGAVDVTARLTEGDLAGAVGALARDGWYFGALGPKRRVALVGELEKRLPPIPVTSVALDLTLRAATRPHYSPLAFDAEGALLVQTAQGLVRVPPGSDRAAAVSADAGTSTWPLEITAGSDRLISVVYSCDRSEVQLLLTGPSTRTLPTTLLAPRPGVCRGGSVAEPIPLAPIAASQAGVEAVLAGTRVHAGAPVGPGTPRGSARSENGQALALSTPLGLIVTGDKTELWKVEGWAVASGSDCVVANGARRAACVRGNRVEIYTR
jgi:hypothetical protein